MSWDAARKLITLLVGGTVLAAGIAMLFLPGPAFLTIPLGVLILAGEFAWARRLQRRMQSLAEAARSEPTVPTEKANGG